MLADLADTKVQHLLALTFDAMRARGLPLPQEITATSSSKPDIYDNASFDRITCAGLPQKYDGSQDNLIPTSQYSLDGQLIFIMLCNHIHRNHLVFVKAVKNKIRTSTLAEHKNDIPGYL